MSWRLFLFIILTPCLSLTAPPKEFNEYTERILLLRTRAGDNIFDSLLAHESDRILYVSATDFFETLGFKTKIVDSDSLFQAKVSSPKLEIEINWKTCAIKSNDLFNEVNCLAFDYYEDDLFISRVLLEEILKAELTYLPYKSELRMFSEEPYPVLSQIKRKKTKKKSLKRFDPGFPKKESTAQSLENFYLDQQISLLLKRGNKGEVGYYSNFVTDISDHEVQITTQGTDRQNDFTTGLVRRDFYGSQKNDYVSTYQLGTVVIPTAEIIGGPTGGHGAYVTNREQQNLISFGQRELEGNLRPNWEVELYVNDILFGRQSGNVQGRYRFTDVPILYGLNNYRLEFYGPQGERTTEYINSNISPRNVKKNQLRYEAGLTFDQPHTEAHSQLSYGISDHFSAYAAFSRYNLQGESDPRDYSVLGINSLRDSFTTSAFYGQDMTGGGSFYALRSQILFDPSNLQILYIDANQFRSSNFFPIGQFIDKSIQADLTTSAFGIASMLYRFNHNIFEDGSVSNQAFQFMVFSINSLSFQLRNDLGHGEDNDVQMIYTYFRNQFRARINYSKSSLESLGLEFRNRFARDSSVFSSLEHNLKTHINLVRAGYQHRLKDFIAGFEALSDGQKNHQIFLRLRTSFGLHTNTPTFQVSSDPLASRGNICARVFHDLNNDGFYQPDSEAPLEGVELSWIQGNRTFKSDNDGHVFLSDLPLYQAADIQLLHASVEDPTLSFHDQGIRAFLQKGQCLKMNFPLVTVNEVEGQIIKSGSDQPPRTTFLLINLENQKIERVRSDREGFFLFPAVPPGKYLLRPENNQKSFTPRKYQLDTNDSQSLDQEFFFEKS